MSDIHIPKVRITYPVVPQGLASPALTKITVDGETWPIVGYKIEESRDTDRQVTITFLADVEMVPIEPQP